MKPIRSLNVSGVGDAAAVETASVVTEQVEVVGELSGVGSGIHVVTDVASAMVEGDPRNLVPEVVDGAAPSCVDVDLMAGDVVADARAPPLSPHPANAIIEAIMMAA